MEAAPKGQEPGEQEEPGGLEEEGVESAPAPWRTACPPAPPRSGCSRSVWRAAAEDAQRNNLDIVSR